MTSYLSIIFIQSTSRLESFLDLPRVLWPTLIILPLLRILMCVYDICCFKRMHTSVTDSHRVLTTLALQQLGAIGALQALAARSGNGNLISVAEPDTELSECVPHEEQELNPDELLKSRKRNLIKQFKGATRRRSE